MAINTTRGTSIFNKMLLSQYHNSPRLKEYIMAFVSELDVLFSTTQEVYEGRLLDNAQGRSLDIIGEILQQSRNLVLSKHYFGFQGHPSAESFGDGVDLNLGGYFRSSEETVDDNTPLSDGVYRNILRIRAYCLNKKAAGMNLDNKGGSLFKYPEEFSHDVNNISNHIGVEAIYDIVHLLVLGKTRVQDPSEEVLVLNLVQGIGVVTLQLDDTKVSNYNLDILEAIKRWFMPAGTELVIHT